jgi:hypothetical protein
MHCFSTASLLSCIIKYMFYLLYLLFSYVTIPSDLYTIFVIIALCLLFVHIVYLQSSAWYYLLHYLLHIFYLLPDTCISYLLHDILLTTCYIQYLLPVILPAIWYLLHNLLCYLLYVTCYLIHLPARLYLLPASCYLTCYLLYWLIPATRICYLFYLILIPATSICYLLLYMLYVNAIWYAILYLLPVILFDTCYTCYATHAT